MTISSGFGASLARHYDKLIAAVTAALLVSAVAVLVLSSGRNATEAQAYEQRLDALSPAHPAMEPLQLGGYSNALGQLARPYRIAVPADKAVGFFLPQSRVWCANRSCGNLVPKASTNCPVCKTVQPIDPTESLDYDGDGGGIPDVWERRYNLNPLDKTDDTRDSDGDGFDNLAEFKGDTDPNDPKSHPDLLALIRVEKIVATKLPLKFMAATLLPDGRHRCQINVQDRTGRAPATFWVVEGETIGKTDFKLQRYIEKTEKRMNKISGTLMTYTDKQVEVGRGDKVFTLKLDQDAVESDYRITLVQTLNNTRFDVAGDGEFLVGDKKYRVIAVDNQATSVVLRNLADGVETKVPGL